MRSCTLRPFQEHGRKIPLAVMSGMKGSGARGRRRLDLDNKRPFGMPAPKPLIGVMGASRSIAVAPRCFSRAFFLGESGAKASAPRALVANT